MELNGIATVNVEYKLWRTNPNYYEIYNRIVEWIQTLDDPGAYFILKQNNISNLIYDICFANEEDAAMFVLQFGNQSDKGKIT